MANSFSTQGSNSINPTSGLLAGAGLLRNPKQQPPKIGFGQASQNAIGGFLNSKPPAPTTPVKSTTITTPDGTSHTQTYHPDTSGSSTSGSSTGLMPTSQTQPAPTSTTPQVGTTKENYQNVLNQSAPTALATGAGEASALYGMLGNERQLQPFAGGQTQGLDQSYANLTRPQSTGNLAGETGLFDVQRGILQNAAQSTASNALAQQGLATQGASTVAGASNLYPTSQGQASFSALGGYQDGGGYFGPSGDPQTAVNKQAFDSLGNQTAQLTADLNGFTANSNLLTNTIGKAGANSGNVPYLTALNQMIQRGVASPADLAAFQAMVTQLQQKGVTISPDLSLDAIKKELDGQIALKQNTITGNQNQMDKLKSGGSSSSGSSTGGSSSGFGWDGQ